MHVQSDTPITPKKYCSKEDLKKVILNSYDAIFVINKAGDVILCNPATAKLLDVEPEELLGKNVRDFLKQGIYDRSIALEALEARSLVTGMLKNRHGRRIMATGTPTFDENGDVVHVVINSRDLELLEKVLKALEKESDKADRYKTAAEYLSGKDAKQKVVAKSSKMRKIIESSAVIAKSDSTVILFGESGTGKEVLARFIHRSSQRSKEPFIPVNCAALPAELLESEFFGYVPGAFTGASSRGKPGLFEIAHKGTLFLDEIGDLPLVMQSKLLRVIETGEVQRLGSTSIFRTNIRLMAATNRNLQAMVDNNKFRSDLYYRLNVIPIVLPPLRERPDDILVLAEKFLEEFNRKYLFNKTFTPKATRVLLNYNWPGNVRELRNVIERLVVTSTEDRMELEDDALIGKERPSYETVLSQQEVRKRYGGTLKDVLRKVEEEYIRQVLSECNGRIGEAANQLGIHRTMLYRKMKSNVQ